MVKPSPLHLPLSLLQMADYRWSACILFTLYHMFDNMDGKHARRTKQVSPGLQEPSTRLIYSLSTPVVRLRSASAHTFPFLSPTSLPRPQTSEVGAILDHFVDGTAGIWSGGLSFFVILAMTEFDIAFGTACRAPVVPLSCFRWRAWSSPGLLVCFLILHISRLSPARRLGIHNALLVRALRARAHGLLRAG